MTAPAELLVLVPRRTPRLEYIFRWMFDRLEGSLEFTTEACYFQAATGPKIQYGGEPVHDGVLYWPSHGLLFEEEITCQQLDPSVRQRILSLPGAETPEDWQDPFSDCFFLLSRYEEYLPFEPDEFGRFSARLSILCTKGLLSFPVADALKQQVQKRLCETFPSLKFSPRTFKVTLTFDVDQAFAHRGKSLPRTIASLIKALLFTPRNFTQELAVVVGKRKDPFDVYDETFRTGLGKVPSIFFMLCSTLRTKYDHQVDTHSQEFKQLIRSLMRRAVIGLHPSYYSSADLPRLRKEKETLQTITGTEISRSRQHYLRLTMPQTYRNLMAAGISEDYSMGYDDQPGFRAGTCNPFSWYDLEEQRATNLQVYPISFLELAFKSHFEKDFESAWSEMKAIMETVKAFSGHLVPVWHNHTMSDWGQYSGWVTLYKRMINWIQENWHGE